MSNLETRKIFRILGKDSVRFVGGCVRNALLGEVIGDIDLATSLPPQNVTERLLKNGIKSIPTGIQHGTVTAVINGKSYEITTLRIDMDTDGRHASVTFSADWQEDAKRRDFTMNALYADMDGHVYDPLGSGISDLKQRKVKFVGDPYLRIKEDYLRILRFFRFHTQYGKGRINAKGYRACLDLKDGLKSLSKERVTQELSKILLSPYAVRGLNILTSCDLLPFLFRQSFEPKAFQRLIDRGTEDVDTALVGRLILLSGASPKTFEMIAKSLVLNKNQVRLLARATTVKIKTIRIDLLNVRKWMVYDGGAQCRLRLDLAYAYGRLNLSEHRRFVEGVIEAGIPDFPIKGGDLSRKGYQGPALGEELDRLKRLWIQSGFLKSREELISAIRAKA